MPRAILFDFFNTLLTANNATRHEVVLKMGADVGVDPDGFAQLFAETWHARMTGQLGDMPHQVRAIAARLDADPSAAQVAVAVERRVTFSRQTIAPTAAVVDLVAAFRDAGWRTGVLSNCTVDSALAIRESAIAATVDAVVLSCEVGLAKPDPKIYQMACDAIGVPTEGCVFVGDGADRELYGAEALGMRVIQSTQFQMTDKAWTGERVAFLADLLPLLGV